MLRFWVLEYVNGQEFVGRFDGRWTRTPDLDVAALFTSEGLAANALQALLQEAEDRIAKNKDVWPAQMWWDFKGGLVVVREVEQLFRLVERTESAQAADAVGQRSETPT